MTSNIPVRPATEADLPAIMEMFGELSPSEPLAEPARAAVIWRELTTRPGVVVLVAEDAGRACATCTLVVMPNLTRGGRPYAFLETVVTRGGVRRRGYGRAVVDAALARAWEAGCYKVMLVSGRREETGVPAFYESCGFRRDVAAGYVARMPAPGSP